MKILYEDNHLIAVWKEAGILAQGDNLGAPSIMEGVKKYLKEKYKKPGNVFLGLLHRLDRPVVGIMLFAKTSKGASRLAEQFRERAIIKTYYAIIEGQMPNKNGVLVHMIEKKMTMHGGRRAKIVKRAGELALPNFAKQNLGGQAELTYETIRSGSRCSLTKINLKTGKFHQIRAQFAAEGHPVMGDIKYGGHISPILTDGAIALAACGLTFTTATGDQEIALKEPYPEKWNKLL